MFSQLLERWPAMIQFIKFGIVGVSNTIVNYVIYLLSLAGLHAWRGGQRYDYLIAQFLAFLLSVLWSFFWNYKYVFTQGKERAQTVAGQLLRAYASYSFTGVFLSSFLLYIEIDLMRMSQIAAPLLNLFISVPVNFWLNKHWTFRQKKI